ncbi:hypothetical protein N7470_005273 [Penicillium chermesinum]|nr:hypothetical protein N7470_005273 [Penicillium chermesinum]
MLPRHAYTGLRQVSTKPSPRRTLLLTFDAFDTLFTPRTSVPEQYASVAHEFGLPRTAITPQAIQSAFKAAYKAQAKKHYNYGRAEVLRGQYAGPKQWWTDVIRATIEEHYHSPCAPAAATPVPTVSSLRASSRPFCTGLPERRATRFSRTWSPSSRGCARSSGPFRSLRRTSGSSSAWCPIRTTGSRRCCAHWGLKVGGLRADQDRSSMELPGFEERGESEVRSSPEIAGLGSVYEFMSQAGRPGVDIDMVITSYEAGEEKPGRVIFDVARRQAGLLLPSGVSAESLWCVHVGDDYEKDYLAARGAGWQSCFLDRKGAWNGRASRFAR